MSQRTGDRLSKGTLLTTLNALRAFFHVAGRVEPGYRSRLTYADADYFALSVQGDKDRQGILGTRRAHRSSRSCTSLRSMPTATDVELRNRALIAFTLLTGARDGAVASFKLKHIDVIEGKVIQDAHEVRTKFSKSFTTWFFPVGEEARQIVRRLGDIPDE